MNKKAKRIIIPAMALAGVGMIGGIAASQLAYLTDSETATNTFTVGKVTVDLEEPNYPGNDSDEVKNIVPNQEIQKDPQVENSGENDLVAFLRVLSPVALVETVADDGTRANNFGPNEIFWMKDTADAISDHANHFDDTDWVEMPAKESGDKYLQAVNQDDGTIAYNEISEADAKAALYNARFFKAVPQADGTVIMQTVPVADIKTGDTVYTIAEEDYADAKADVPTLEYENAAAAVTAGFVALQNTAPAQAGDPTPVQARLNAARIYKSYVFGSKSELAPKDKTEPIFDKVQLKNIIEGDIDTREQNIILETYAIQSDNIISSGAVVDTTNLNADNLGTIYNIFVKQGTAGLGEEAQASLQKNVEQNEANVTLDKDINGNGLAADTYRLDMSLQNTKIVKGAAATQITTVLSKNNKVQTLDGVTYESKNPSVATVSADGKVTGVTVGTAVIEATHTSGAKTQIEVTVVNPAETPAP